MHANEQLQLRFYLSFIGCKGQKKFKDLKDENIKSFKKKTYLNGEIFQVYMYNNAALINKYGN